MIPTRRAPAITRSLAAPPAPISAQVPAGERARLPRIEPHPFGAARFGA